MKEFLKFGVVGMINTLITIGCFTVLVYSGINYITANIIAYMLGMINSFIWNKNWVFQTNANTGLLLMCGKFIAVNLITLGFTTILLFILVGHQYFHLSIAQIISTGFGLLINYGLNRKWTFKVSDPI
ncbi:GtrA family protein [Bacillus sp. S3]|uniref:GtrA family protein n=1 Tax=Bacillus sp. S3 TaxID=486398 RepID=UPI00118D1AAA|nr:GtrA family protein [Bacillus sp. S3]QCJ44133.1 GtrA family protein [Bacillus sp. S3]